MGYPLIYLRENKEFLWPYKNILLDKIGQLSDDAKHQQQRKRCSMYTIPCYEFICYNKDGEVIGEYFSKDYPTMADYPAGTVRVDIAIPQD